MRPESFLAESNLAFTICVLTVCIPGNHEIYMKFKKIIKNITLSNLVQEISRYCICEGIENDIFFQYTNQHSIPKIFNLNVATVVNLQATCGTAVRFYFRTILLTYFMKTKNVDFIYFQNYA